MPDFTTLVNNPHLTLVLVSLEKLYDFALDIEIIELVSFLLSRSTICGGFVQRLNVLVGKDWLRCETLLHPLAQGPDKFVLLSFDLARLAKEN